MCFLSVIFYLFFFHERPLFKFLVSSVCKRLHLKTFVSVCLAVGWGEVGGWGGSEWGVCKKPVISCLIGYLLSGSYSVKLSSYYFRC